MPVRERLEPTVRVLGAATGIGLVFGTLVGGIGGRVAMRLIFLTSDDTVRGAVSDDGFIMGRISGETTDLLVTGALFGVVGTFVYLGVRPYMIGPRWVRVPTCGTAAGAVLGALIVNPDGVDFTRLSPVPLSVALFVAIPALFAVLTALALEHALRPAGWANAAPLPVVAAPLAVFAFPPLLIVLGVPVALVLGGRSVGRRWAPIAAVADHRALFWAARLSWGAVAGIGVVALAEDILALA